MDEYEEIERWIKRADRGMSGKMAGRMVKRVGIDSGIGSRKGVKGDKDGVRDRVRGNVKGGVKDRVRDNVKDGVKDRVRDSVRDGVKDRVRGNVKDSKHKVRDGEGKNGAGESGKRFDGNEGAFSRQRSGEKRRDGSSPRVRKGAEGFSVSKNKMERLLMLKGGERIPKEEAHMGDGEADGATVSARC